MLNAAAYITEMPHVTVFGSERITELGEQELHPLSSNFHVWCEHDVHGDVSSGLHMNSFLRTTISDHSYET